MRPIGVPRGGAVIDRDSYQPDIPDSVVFQIDANSLGLSDGDPVTSWGDQVGSNDLSGGDPTYQTDQNLNPTVVGNGTNDQLINTSPSGLPSGSDARTVMLVVEIDSATSGATFLAYGDDADGERLSVEQASQGGSPGGYRVDVFGGYAVTAGGYFGAGETHLLTVTFPSSGSSTNDLRLRDNGSDVSLDQVITQSINTQQNYISAFAKNGSNYSADAVSEAIIHDEELTGSSLSDEEQRVANKWGITL
jgi:hypothetical protein